MLNMFKELKEFMEKKENFGGKKYTNWNETITREFKQEILISRKQSANLKIDYLNNPVWGAEREKNE